MPDQPVPSVVANVLDEGSDILRELQRAVDGVTTPPAPEAIEPVANQEAPAADVPTLEALRTAAKMSEDEMDRAVAEYEAWVAADEAAGRAQPEAQTPAAPAPEAPAPVPAVDTAAEIQRIKAGLGITTS
jgi:hypothetical protein